MWPEHNTLTCETKHRILKPDCGLRVIRDFYHFWVSSLGLTTTVVQLAHKFWTFEYLYVIKCNTHLNDCGLRIMFLSPTFINVYNPDAEYKYNRSNILLSTAFSEPTVKYLHISKQDKNKHFIPIILFINVYILFCLPEHQFAPFVYRVCKHTGQCTVLIWRNLAYVSPHTGVLPVYWITHCLVLQSWRKCI